jgi:hypothetical protein
MLQVPESLEVRTYRVQTQPGHCPGLVPGYSFTLVKQSRVHWRWTVRWPVMQIDCTPPGSMAVPAPAPLQCACCSTATAGLSDIAYRNGKGGADFEGTQESDMAASSAQMA